MAFRTTGLSRVSGPETPTREFAHPRLSEFDNSRRASVPTGRTPHFRSGRAPHPPANPAQASIPAHPAWRWTAAHLCLHDEGYGPQRVLLHRVAQRERPPAPSADLLAGAPAAFPPSRLPLVHPRCRSWRWSAARTGPTPAEVIPTPSPRPLALPPLSYPPSAACALAPSPAQTPTPQPSLSDSVSARPNVLWV
jgi:hypothetical protein